MVSLQNTSEHWCVNKIWDFFYQRSPSVSDDIFTATDGIFCWSMLDYDRPLPCTANMCQRLWHTNIPKKGHCIFTVYTGWRLSFLWHQPLYLTISWTWAVTLRILTIDVKAANHGGQWSHTICFGTASLSYYLKVINGCNTQAERQTRGTNRTNLGTEHVQKTGEFTDW